ncbi:hypothetical protein [Bacillus alkalicellulosilyticus]|uniref:hypothetical protein n=1 Tax=Alkalihalobacterium alkalicellulosilyticum TaxID=1912214 RepID=UPI00099864F2|nr:hypothetical protein [Bacillus alkalicellulosilyticus]
MKQYINTYNVLIFIINSMVTAYFSVVMALHSSLSTTFFSLWFIFVVLFQLLFSFFPFTVKTLIKSIVKIGLHVMTVIILIFIFQGISNNLTGLKYGIVNSLLLFTS